MERFLLNSCIRGHHEYNAVWSQCISETLLCQPEFGNIMNPYTVSIITEDEVVSGHNYVSPFPQMISSHTSSFTKPQVISSQQCLQNALNSAKFALLKNKTNNLYGISNFMDMF